MEFAVPADEKINFKKSIAFIIVHLSVFLVFWAGISWIAVAACLFFYAIRMFGITAGFHRYFSHRTYKTSRFFQFVLAWLGTSAAQKGPLWWAAHHRHHHRHSDTELDVHSPRMRGFWWSHVGWILCDKFNDTKIEAVKDLASFPELRFLNRHHMLPPTVTAIAIFMTGVLLNHFVPSLNTSGFQLLVWGFFVSTVLLYHGTFTVNSLTHVFGHRRFKTSDDSRNSFWISLITLGEGWHNNHHRFPGSERQGFYWWEIDLSHYVLKLLSWVKVVWDIKIPPATIYLEAAAARRSRPA